MSYHRMKLYKRGTVVWLIISAIISLVLSQKPNGVAQRESFSASTLLLSILESTSCGDVHLSARSSSQHATGLPTYSASWAGFQLFRGAQDRWNASPRCVVDEPGKVKYHANNAEFWCSYRPITTRDLFLRVPGRRSCIYPFPMLTIPMAVVIR